MAPPHSTLIATASTATISSHRLISHLPVSDRLLRCQFKHSSKTERLLQEIAALKQEDPTIKSLIFSQWTSVNSLTAHLISHQYSGRSVPLVAPSTNCRLRCPLPLLGVCYVRCWIWCKSHSSGRATKLCDWTGPPFSPANGVAPPYPAQLSLTSCWCGVVVMCGWLSALSQKQRESVLHQFKSDPSATLMLVSLKAGGVGLNLTSASCVFFLDLVNTQ